MKYNWIDDFLLSKKGVTKDFQEDWNWIRYKIDMKKNKVSFLVEI